MSLRSPLLASLSVLLLPLTACGAEESNSGPTQAQFLRTSAQLTAAADDPGTLPVDLMFAAPVDDPIWSGIQDLTLTNDLPDEGDIILAGNSASAEPGDEHAGARFGSITVDVDVDERPFELSQISLATGEDQSAQHFDVGSWSLDQAEPTSTGADIHPTGDYPGVLPDCGPTSLSVENSPTGGPVTGVTGTAPGTRFTDVEIETNTRTDVSFDVDCDDSYDLHQVTPKVSVAGEPDATAVLPYIQFGLMSLTAEDAPRILDR
ncbi:hypothetical protein ACT3SZ_00300 [Corynebacterium sp. AOP40-9SA-29]|uniref:hypothetical protein n=1 Tax=Corynebacterium sp. AOP40-9SA-29 TaxID=3457677 RepID=UPI0040344F95